MKLIAVILTRNEAEHIAACIESVKFADDVLVLDSFSDDDTVTLAKSAGARTMQRAFQDYASQRNAALDSVKGSYDWVLFVDADERVTPELAEEIRSAIVKAGYAGWRIPRQNYIFGRLTKGAGWYPDYQTRLLKVGAAHYDPNRKVHELVILNGTEGTLNNHFVHYNYRDGRQFAEKQRRYGAYDAGIMMDAGIRPKPHNYILQPLRQFWWRYVTLKGYQDGLHGLRLSLLLGWYEFRKYVLLGQFWREGKGRTAARP